MDSRKDAEYRLVLARGFYQEALQDFELSRWRSCVDHAQLSVENSGKAIISIFGPVEKTHEPVEQLKWLLASKVLKEEIKQLLESALPIFAELGFEEHFLSDYGDEKNYIDPWKLFDEQKARNALYAAQQCLETATRIHTVSFTE